MQYILPTVPLVLSLQVVSSRPFVQDSYATNSRERAQMITALSKLKGLNLTSKKIQIFV